MAKNHAKSSDLFFRSRDDESASTSVPLPSPWLYQSAVFPVSVASTCRTAWKQKERSRSVDVHMDSLMLIAMVGPKLEDTKTSVLIHQACMEFCSRCERQKFNYSSGGLL